MFNTIKFTIETTSCCISPGDVLRSPLPRYLSLLSPRTDTATSDIPSNRPENSYIVRGLFLQWSISAGIATDVENAEHLLVH